MLKEKNILKTRRVILMLKAYMKISLLTFSHLPNKALLHSACGEDQPRPACRPEGLSPRSWGQLTVRSGCCPKGKTVDLARGVDQAQPHPSGWSKWGCEIQAPSQQVRTIWNAHPTLELPGELTEQLAGTTLPSFHSVLILRSHLKILV